MQWYSGLHLGMSCNLQPHGVEFLAKAERAVLERANLHLVRSLRIARELFRYWMVKL